MGNTSQGTQINTPTRGHALTVERMRTSTISGVDL
jgi:hypothetical protein